MKKRLLSLLLALTMALSLATTGAWAADQDSIQVTVTRAPSPWARTIPLWHECR